MRSIQTTVTPEPRLGFNETTLNYKNELEIMYSLSVNIKRFSRICALIDLCNKQHKACLDNIRDYDTGKISNLFGAREDNFERIEKLEEIKRYLTKKLIK